MLGNEEHYEKMHNNSYTLFSQWWDRAVGMGNGTWRDLKTIRRLKPDPFFVNAHHRGLFASRYSALYHHLFDGRPMGNMRKSLEMSNLKFMYPNLSNKLTAL